LTPLTPSASSRRTALALGTGAPNGTTANHHSPHDGRWTAVSGRSFSHTPAVHKGKKSASRPARGADAEPDTSSAQPAGAHEAFSFDDVEAAWDKAASRAAERLADASGGGSLDAEALGRVAVRDRAGGASTPLRELAVVVPGRGGRTAEIRLHSAGSRKAVVSAVQADPAFGQQPQPDPANELVLTLKLDVEGAEARVGRAREACRDWRDGVRDVTRRRRDALRAWKTARTLGPDDFRRLEKELLKLQDGRLRGVETREKEVVRAIEARQGML